MKKILSVTLSLSFIICVNIFPFSAKAESPKLIIHWSSVDGVDLVEPLAFEADSSDKTVKEILQEKGKQYSDEFFKMEGYTDLGFRMPEPITNYNNYTQLIVLSAELKNRVIGENDLNIYCMMFKNTESASVEVKNPICGISTTIDKIYDDKYDNGYYYDYCTQSNYPHATIPNGVNYHLVSADEAGVNGAYWSAEAALHTGPFIGTFEGGKQYAAIVYLVSDFGYLIDNENGQFFVNGVSVKDSFGKRGTFCGIVSLTAEHVSDSGSVNKKPSYTAKGIKTYKCKNCGMILKTEELPKLKKVTNTVIVKGKTVRIKAHKLRKKKIVFKRKKVIKVTNAKGKVSYKKIKGNKVFTVSKCGNITVKKEIKKGTYKIKVKVKAKGTSKYKTKTKTVTVKIIIE